jgi:hypothetical protein
VWPLHERACAQENTRRSCPGTSITEDSEKEIIVLSTIIVVLLVLWLLGLVTSYTLGGFIHLLLAVAIIVVLLRVIQGRNLIHG